MKREKPVHIVIAVPVDDGARSEFWLSLLSLIITVPTVFKKNVTFELKTNPGDSLITRSRNNLTHEFLHATNGDYLLFLDTDLDFTPQDIKRLVQNRREDAVVCGQYAIKQAGLRFCYNPLKGEVEDQNGLLRVAEAGTGCMLIPRKILQTIADKGRARLEYTDDQFKDKRISFFDVGVVGGRYLSEDWLFCRRVRECGFSVLIDLEVLMGHHGWIRYPLPDEHLVEAVSSRCANKELHHDYRQRIDRAVKARWTQPSKAGSAKASRNSKVSLVKPSPSTKSLTRASSASKR